MGLVPQINLFKKSAPYLAKVLSNEKLTPTRGTGKRPHNEGYSDVHRIILSVDHNAYPYIIGQSAGIIPPGQDPEKVAKGSENTEFTVRLYSIASPSFSFGLTKDKLEFIIKRDDIYDENGDIKHKGVCSNYMCDLKVGDEVVITGPAGKKFLLPDSDFDGDIYFLATGTGIAPFFGMTEELLNNHQIKFNGNIYLIYGAPYSDEIVLREEFNQYSEKFKQFHFYPVASREEKNSFDNGKKYIFHQLMELSENVKNSFKKDSKLYICGGPKGMEKGVIEALKNILDPSKTYEDFKKEYESKNKLFVETY
jgi:ferredoxin--NADP+ reductase